MKFFFQNLLGVYTNYVLYVENRDGHSDAKSFQEKTLKRLFGLLQGQGIQQFDNFRTDAASYQYQVIQPVEKHATHFYTDLRNSYVEKYFPQIDNWQEGVEAREKKYGQYTTYKPFVNHYKAQDVYGKK